jgi:hypothetical protein
MAAPVPPYPSLPRDEGTFKTKLREGTLRELTVALMKQPIR